MGSMSIKATDFTTFSRALRVAQPKLGKNLRSAIGKVGRRAATTMRAGVPHQESSGDWGTLRGVRFSDAASSKGGAIVIDHLAYTFGVGQPSRPGRYKHKVWGVWSGSRATIMPVSDFIAVGWAQVGTGLELAADAALDATILELAGE